MSNLECLCLCQIFRQSYKFKFELKISRRQLKDINSINDRKLKLVSQNKSDLALDNKVLIYKTFIIQQMLHGTFRIVVLIKT